MSIAYDASAASGNPNSSTELNDFTDSQIALNTSFHPPLTKPRRKHRANPAVKWVNQTSARGILDNAVKAVKNDIWSIVDAGPDVPVEYKFNLHGAWLLGRILFMAGVGYVIRAGVKVPWYGLTGEILTELCQDIDIDVPKGAALDRLIKAIEAKGRATKEQIGNDAGLTREICRELNLRYFHPCDMTADDMDRERKRADAVGAEKRRKEAAAGKGRVTPASLDTPAHTQGL